MSSPGSDQAPTLVWFRRDLRLTDNPALYAAVQAGRPIIPVFVLETSKDVRAVGGAGRWWLDKSLRALAAELAKRGSRLVLRQGSAERVMAELAQETGAASIFWNRLYDPGQLDCDGRLSRTLAKKGVEALTFNGDLLLEPWELKTKGGGYYQVFTPFWRAAKAAIGDPVHHRAPANLGAPIQWPRSEDLNDWRLHPTRPDWSKGFKVWEPGEAGGKSVLEQFASRALGDYDKDRNRPDHEGISRLSPYLHWGEVGPGQVWRTVRAAASHHPERQDGLASFLSELGWREFNHHLLFQRPDLPTTNFKPEFDSFPWREDEEGFSTWTRGQTGYPLVDAGMRQLWVTGFMHNRVRMVTASFLIKHLLVDWRQGERWFWDTLVDASPANNVLNWQWVAGSGADAAPFFRIFNPVAQGERFDPLGDYVRTWVPELAKLDAKHIHAPWLAPPEALAKAGVALGGSYPAPIIDHDRARQRALAAYKGLRQSTEEQ